MTELFQGWTFKLSSGLMGLVNVWFSLGDEATVDTGFDFFPLSLLLKKFEILSRLLFSPKRFFGDIRVFSVCLLTACCVFCC